MHKHGKLLKISEKAFDSFQEYVYSRTGIFLQSNKKYLIEHRLSHRIVELGLPDFESYLKLIISKPAGNAEEEQLVDTITTHETSFFRDMPQLAVFADDIIKRVADIVRSKKQQTIKVWSNACSTGEEPYTLAMLFYDRKHLWSDLKLEVLGTDISQGVVEIAREGVFGDNSMRNTPQDAVRRYFRQRGELYHVIPELKKVVRFETANLIDRLKMKTYSGFHVIFCRNVLIYFDDKSKRTVLSSIAGSLVQNGVLMIGHSESLLNITTDFKMESIRRIPVYTRV